MDGVEVYVNGRRIDDGGIDECVEQTYKDGLWKEDDDGQVIGRTCA